MPRKPTMIADPSILSVNLRKRFGFTDDEIRSVFTVLEPHSVLALTQNYLHIRGAGFSSQETLGMIPLLGSSVSDVDAWKLVGSVLDHTDRDVEVAYYATQAGFDASNIGQLAPQQRTKEKFKSLVMLKQL